jgi:tRNA pseudouridine13 synthase
VFPSTYYYMENVSAFLTADLPGTGGVIKMLDTDFFVEELPRYPAAGAGTHTFVFIEKKGLGTREALARISLALGIPRRVIGTAGLKDTHAVTRQWISVEHVPPERIAALNIPDIDILEVTQHSNKLKPGHLAGNRFVIRVRKLALPIEEAARTAEQILSILSRRGVPNFFGPQRFGNRVDNHLLGRAVIDNDADRVIDLFIGKPETSLDSALMLEARAHYVAGRYQEAFDLWPRQILERRRVLKSLIINKGNKKRAFHAMDKHLKGFFISAYQSFIFNRVLTARMPDIDKLLHGDMAYKHDNGACFRVEDSAAEQPRCDRLEISPTGPLFGLRMTRLTGPAGEIENPIIEQEGLTDHQLRLMKRLGAPGGRRPLRFIPRHASVASAQDDFGPYLELRFELDAGCYATTLLAEITKNQLAEEPVEQHSYDSTADPEA